MKLKYILVAVVAALTGLSSCTGFLDETSNPNYLTPSTFWKNELDIEKGLTAAYARLQPSMSWGAPYERFIVLDSYRSDELDFRADVPEWSRLAMFANTSTDWSCCMGEWSELYKGINYSNQCIDNIPNVPGISDELKNRSISEARFLRAYYYYRLYINFGEMLPLITKEIKGSEEEYYPQQAKEGEIIAFIESELLDIQQYLPEPEFWASKPGRAHKYMASAILAKYYMFRKDLAKAETELSKIINSGKFELVDNYADLWDGLHKNSKESIFEIQFSGSEEGGKREFNRIALHLAASNAEGYEEAYPSRWLFETMKNDLTEDGEYSQRLYSTILFNDPKTTAFYFTEDKNSFKDWHDRDDAIYWHKFMTWDPSLSSHWMISAFNIPVVRYADVLLLYAECLNDRGATSEAIKYINEVRDRVDVTPISQTMSQAEVLKHLQDVERPCELALEGGRWYDLIRWGIVEEALRAHNKPYVNNFIATKHTLMPIPHDEFLLNPDWVQNPGYSK